MTKQELRKEIKHLKAAYSREELAALSRDITGVLAETQAWQQAHTVLLYHSLPDEVATHDLIIRAADSGRRVLLPVVVGDDLELREFRSCEGLSEGAYHILEPQGKAFTDYSEIDLAVIPGVAFTIDGRRLGRGRGYYDRLLARLSSHTMRIGLCWPFQIVDDIPTEPHDRLMNSVMTVSCQQR